MKIPEFKKGNEVKEYLIQQDFGQQLYLQKQNKEPFNKGRRANLLLLKSLIQAKNSAELSSLKVIDSFALIA